MQLTTSTSAGEASTGALGAGGCFGHMQLPRFGRHRGRRRGRWFRPAFEQSGEGRVPSWIGVRKEPLHHQIVQSHIGYTLLPSDRYHSTLSSLFGHYELLCHFPVQALAPNRLLIPYRYPAYSCRRRTNVVIEVVRRSAGVKARRRTRPARPAGRLD